MLAGFLQPNCLDPLGNPLVSFVKGRMGCIGTGTGISIPEGRGIWGVYSTINSATAVEVEMDEPDCTGQVPGGLPEPERVQIGP